MKRVVDNKKNFLNKKAQGMSITTIILIVLGLVVLVVLILGFTQGWSKILPWISPSNNVNEIMQKCSLACSIGNKYDYCSAKRDLVLEDKTIKDTTCYVLSQTPSYGIEACSTIDCGIYEDEASAIKACSTVNEKLSYIDNQQIKEHTCKEGEGSIPTQ